MGFEIFPIKPRLRHPSLRSGTRRNLIGNITNSANAVTTYKIFTDFEGFDMFLIEFWRVPSKVSGV